MARILLIESDKIVADNVSQALKRLGHKVDWRRDPQTAVDSADSKIPDVVILDLLLAGRSGIEFLHEFRSYPEWQSLPAIIYSNVQLDEFQATEGFEQLGIAAYHYKPATELTDLLASVNLALQSAPVK